MVITFFTSSLNEYMDRARREIAAAVRKLSNDEIAASDPVVLSKAVVAPFELNDVPALLAEPPEMDDPEYPIGANHATITVYIPYTGNAEVFRYFISGSPLPYPVYEVSEDRIAKQYQVDKHRIESIDEKVKHDKDIVEQYLAPLRQHLPHCNDNLLQFARSGINERLKEIEHNTKATAALANSQIRIRKRNDGTEKVIIPIQRKKLLVPRKATATAAPEFLIEMGEYDGILATISSMVTVMERTPSVFAEMKEEPLRTILLVALNGIYEGQATGETFNGVGKTDILIRRDDKNVFIAECLMWKGPQYLLSKMNDQLFQYAVWRDSKLALIIFNRGGTFSSTIKTMKETVKSHPQCVKELLYPHESGARFTFKRHDDPDRHFTLTALAFNVPE